SPMLDLVRDPRWGRVMESTGEDPFLNSELGKALVDGYQGDASKLDGNFERMAACVKHFAAYGAAEAGLEYNTVNMS
ncbi:TPA: beta-glucosidase, partial [Listeria monocytogenes]|nr:beta-glucosidase [Listeria monocytogenes]